MRMSETREIGNCAVDIVAERAVQRWLNVIPCESSMVISAGTEIAPPGDYEEAGSSVAWTGTTLKASLTSRAEEFHSEHLENWTPARSAVRLR
jgi:hypothetical protein